ncbi:MAG TPA: hypothetical protein VII60_04660 [Acidimicrobiales bacterium]
MKLTRLIVAMVLLAALVVASFHTTSSSYSSPVAAPCTSSALAGAFTSQFKLTSMQKFGCEGEWAYAWATVGTGEQAIGVTEVMRFEQASQRWVLVSRGRDCKASILPSIVYRLGCFSN